MQGTEVRKMCAICHRENLFFKSVVSSVYFELNCIALKQPKLWQVLKEMGVPDHLIYLLRNLYVGQEATLRTGYGTTGWFKTGKGVQQGCILSPCLFNLYAEYIM